MKTAAWLPLMILALAPVAGCATSHNGFDNVVSSLEQHYSVHAQRMPMMGLISLCARATTHGGVKGMRLAEFDHLDPHGDLRQLEQVVSDSLDSQWQHFVTEREAGGELNLIFVRPNGAAMDMLIADYDHGELDIVRLDVNGDRLQPWMRDPKNSARHHDNQSNTPD